MFHHPIQTKGSAHASQSLERGFTLIEMVVTVAIFAILSTIVIARNAAFDNEVLLNNLAYDIALSIREAQQFGINVRGSAGQFDAPYGVHFDAGAKTYSLFLDKDKDGIYDSGPTGELVEAYTLGRGASIRALCDLSSTESCTQSTLDVVFRRPDPDAVINNGAVSRARIELLSGRGQGVRYIIVESTGQISIERP